MTEPRTELTIKIDILKAKYCACCGETQGLERHHLYSVKDGCPDELQVWLCHKHHLMVHRRAVVDNDPLHHASLQRAGIERARAIGKYRIGRKATARAQTDEVRKMRAEGVTPHLIAKALGMSTRSVYRALEATEPSSA